MKHLMISMILVLAGLVNGAVAQGQQPDQQQGRHDESSADHQFAVKVAEANLAEVAMADLALNQASDNDVKQFAKEMRDDHTKANNELKEWASKKNMTLPAEPNTRQQQTRDRLSKLSGSEFDREFVREMVKDHQQVVALFEKQANNGRDPELKAWAAQTLPTLREHLNESRRLAGKLGVSPGNMPKTNKGE